MEKEQKPAEQSETQTQTAVKENVPTQGSAKPKFTPAKTAEEKQMQAMMGGSKVQDAHYVVGKSKENHTFVEDSFKPQATLYIKNCQDCEYVIDSMCTKIFIEGCQNTKVTLNHKIITSVVELYKCETLALHINTNVGTLQSDMCKKLHVEVKHQDLFKNLVWAGVHDLTLHFLDDAQHRLESGYTQMKSLYPNLVEETDQFITRIVKGKLLTEKIIRLDNGYPTTEREKKEFDDKQEEALKILAANAGISIGPKKKSGPKLKPNDPCHCGSNKKFKKCHGAAA